MLAQIARGRTSRLITTLVVFLAVLAGTLGQASPVWAATAPSGLRADANAGVVPTFSWDAPEDATRFEIQVSRDQSFQQLVVNEGTVNTSYVPRTVLPVGNVYWRVRAIDAAGSASSYSNASYNQPPLAGPGLSTPAAGAVVNPPADSVKLTWEAVPGATQYAVQISRDSAFTNVEYRADLRATAYVLADLPVSGTWFWRVQARISGDVNTAWSSTRSFVYGQLPAVSRIAPSADEVVQDSVLRWSPVPGATSYDLQISTDINFQANSLVHERLGILGTTYARQGTLNNDQYYWRVRARDANDNVQDWSRAEVWRFERAWPHQPDLAYPANDARVGDPVYFEWRPIPHASRYELQIAADRFFNDPVTRCSTTATSYTPRAGDCMPAAEGTYYWRVLAYDEFSETPARTTDTLCPVGADPSCESIEVRRFTYAPSLVTKRSPLDGSTMTLPTLTWEPFAGAARYRVTINSTTPGGPSISDDTPSTSYTARSTLPPGTYRWDVMTLSEDGRVGSSIIASSEPEFTVEAAPAATATRPEPAGPLSGTFARFPTLGWDAVTGADYYRIWLRQAGTLAWDVRPTTFSYPAGEDTTTDYLAAGDYEWQVEAYKPNGSTSRSLTTGRFTISAPPAVTGHRVALTNAGLAAGETCAATLPDECQNLRQTPVLSWDPQPGAGYYKLYIARDRALTNIYRGYNGITVNNTRWTPTDQFEDSQAGSAYYWLVVPCKTANACGPKTLAGHAFNNKSNPVKIVSPGVEKVQNQPPVGSPTKVANAVTLSWEDYLSTNTTSPKGDTVLSTKSTTEARQYRVQVSQDENFQSLVDDRQVDQLQYTAFDRTYPEGPLYWRVQAFDGSDHQLSWSSTYMFEKVSPTPNPTLPVDAGTVNGSVTVGWLPLAYARSYDVEIYRDADTNASPSKLVASGNSRQVSWAPADALPVSDQPYVWRVRARDAAGREGAWATWRSFVVRDAVPELVSPSANTRIHPTRTTFTWRSVSGASRYRWQWRVANDVGRGDQTETQGLAYAPVAGLPDGTIEWRVLPLDARGEITVRPADRDTLWRRFTVGNAPQAVSPPQISGSPQVGSVLTGSAPTWLENGVRTSYQWLRDGNPIAGATSLSYQTVRDDLTRTVSLRAFGDLAGFSQATSNSNSMVISAGPAPTLAGSFLISSPGRVGDTIQPTAAVWNETGVSTAARWMLDGKEIADGANPLTLTPAYVGKSITLRAIGRRDGYGDADVQSNPITVLPGAATVSASPVAITGKPTVGETLSVSGTWSNQPQLSYQWMVDGAPVAGEVGANYRVRAADAARSVSASVVAMRDGYETGGATTPSVLIAKLTSTTEVALSAPTATKKTVKKVKVAVTVRVPEVPGPVGSIKVYDGKKVIKTVKLSAARQGVTLVKVGKLKKGKHKIKAVFLGTPAVNGSKSKVVKLTVTK